MTLVEEEAEREGGDGGKKAGVLLGLFPLLEGPGLFSFCEKSLLMKAVSLNVRR